MQITDILRETDVVLDIPGTSKPSILAKMSGVVAVSSSHDDAQILHALMAREALGPTGIGGGIGLPHARLPFITAPVSIFARLKTPVDFDAVDGRPVDLAFLLLLPNDARVLQIPALACATRCLRDCRVVQKIRSAISRADVYAAITLGVLG
jgi:nitrogen PTS system EIIA component